MSKFQSIISNSFKESNNLTKVRIKIDPAKWDSSVNVNDLDEFTGYILQEYDDGTVDVFVPDAESSDPIFNMQSTNVQQVDRYSKIKELIKQCMSSMGVNNTDIISGIDKADCIHVLEDWMRQGGCSDGQIIDIFKEYISETN